MVVEQLLIETKLAIALKVDGFDQQIVRALLEIEGQLDGRFARFSFVIAFGEELAVEPDTDKIVGAQAHIEFGRGSGLDRAMEVVHAMNALQSINEGVSLAILVAGSLSPAEFVANAGIGFRVIDGSLGRKFFAKSGFCVFGFERADHSPGIEPGTEDSGEHRAIRGGGEPEASESLF